MQFVLLHIPEDVACIPVVSIIYGGMQNRKVIVGDNRDQKFALRTCFKDSLGYQTLHKRGRVW